MANLSELSDDDYRAHWQKFSEALDWSTHVDMTDVDADTLVARPKGSFVEGARAKHFQESTRYGELNAAHKRRQRYRDSIVADPSDISRLSAIDETLKLRIDYARALRDFARSAMHANRSRSSENEAARPQARRFA